MAAVLHVRDNIGRIVQQCDYCVYILKGGLSAVWHFLKRAELHLQIVAIWIKFILESRLKNNLWPQVKYVEIYIQAK